MRAVINQPNYIPWRGYFDLIDDADLFIIFDDVQYTPRDWRSRNTIKSKQGPVWLTVPVKKMPRDGLICEAEIDYSQDWIKSHLRQIADAYASAAYYKVYASGIAEFLNRRFERLVDLNVETTLFLMQALSIRTPIRRASEMGVTGHKTERLIQLLKKIGADTYLSGPAAKDYIEVDRFKEAEIGLLWKRYDYVPYPQLWGPFEPQVSVLDLLFNCGPDARAFLKSRQPHEVAF